MNALPIALFLMSMLPQLIPLQSAGIRMWILDGACSLMISSSLMSMFVIMTSVAVLKIHSTSGCCCIIFRITKILAQPIGMWVSGMGGLGLAIIGFPAMEAPPSLA